MSSRSFTQYCYGLLYSRFDLRDCNIIKNALDPTLNQNVATKNYVDKNTITIVEGVMTSDIKISAVFDRVRSLGCTDLTLGKRSLLTRATTQTL